MASMSRLIPAWVSGYSHQSEMNTKPDHAELRSFVYERAMVNTEYELILLIVRKRQRDFRSEVIQQYRPRMMGVGIPFHGINLGGKAEAI